MKTTHLPWVLPLAALGLTVEAAEYNSPKIALSRSPNAVELSWPATSAQADGSLVRPYFEVQYSADLRHWQPWGERLRASLTDPQATLTLTLPVEGTGGFYRLLAVSPSGVAKLSQDGAEVFGYADAFAEALSRLGQISPEQFAALYPNPATYLPGITWDPTEAQFWPEFAADPSQFNAGKTNGQAGYRYNDYRLNARELELFKKNGFVVSGRLPVAVAPMAAQSPSYADAFYRIWHDDLPVFISCDAILQAWHRTYDAMLEEMEETYLMDSVQTMVEGMAAQIPQSATEAGAGALKDSLGDADYFLAVARSLLAGTNRPSLLGQDARVAGTLKDIKAEALKQVPDFMGFCRMVDFSQFKVRGHYTHTERLGRYFQCMMWLGRIDIPVAGGPWERCPNEPRYASPRELGTAIVLWSLLEQSGRFDTWANMERLLQTFVGWTDSLTFGPLGGLLAGAGIHTLADVNRLAVLERLQTDIASGQLGVQNIRSDWFAQPLDGRYALPQTFTVFGQKFVPDSWAFSQTVSSSILWVENGQTNQVPRRVPGALDVAFSVLGNDQVVPDLVGRIQKTILDTNRPHAMAFRDGLPYQHNLAAVRMVMDQQADSAWESNIYMDWIACLRALSPPTTDARYPETMRTRAWAMKTLNTQLASWTQLRHDTILYAKQSYTSYAACSYPVGYIEPRLEFWSRLRQMAERTADLIAAQSLSGSYLNIWNSLKPVTLSEIQSRQTAHLRQFAATMARLEGLVRKELAQECFTPADESYLNRLMEAQGYASAGCYRVPTYSGWYPQLFYRAIYWVSEARFHEDYGAGATDALIADVHTDVPSDLPPDPGSVLHEAVGRVNLLMMAVDNGAERFLCAGPVASHYELEVIGAPSRLSDADWKQLSGLGFSGGEPVTSPIEGLQPPLWTQSYLAP